MAGAGLLKDPALWEGPEKSAFGKLAAPGEEAGGTAGTETVVVEVVVAAAGATAGVAGGGSGLACEDMAQAYDDDG